MEKVKPEDILKNYQKNNNKTLIIIIAISSLILIISSSLRHYLFQSTAYDLGIFDNGIYLISQNQNPFVTFRGLHILGDHAAFILYPIALFYKIYPDVHWLFILQGLSLSIAALPIYYLSIQAGLEKSQGITMSLVYLLYPLIFNVNLFDFHPEVIATPLIFAIILAARLNKLIYFCLGLILILGCKAVLSLNMMAMGIWLIFFEKKKKFGMIALGVSIPWFLIATKVIIPNFSGTEAAAVGRYSFLGNSVFEIALNLLIKPHLVLSKLFTLANLEYLILLFIPLIWGLSIKHLAPLIAALPTIFLNLLTDYHAQKDLIHQYSLPILPFLIVAIIDNWSFGKIWFRNQKIILIWSIICFLALAKFGYFWTRYLGGIDNLRATKTAVSKVITKGSVLTNSQIAPHLTHRSVLELALDGSETKDLKQFEYILLNLRHPGWGSSPETVNQIILNLQNNHNFDLEYHQEDVFLFTRK
jgi:uncharacterized membrane protein